MKRWICVILLICITILAVGCDKSSGAGSMIYYEQTNPPKIVDPLLATTASEWVIVQHMFEPLFRADESGEIVPAAAKKVDVSADGLTYTITIRDGLKWSDNVPLTAHDFAFALTRALLPETKSTCAYQLTAIECADMVQSGMVTPDNLGVSAIDDRTLVLNLSVPDANLTVTLSGAAGMPCRQDFFEGCGGRYGMGEDYVIASGRFAITRWVTTEKEERVRMAKNELYYRADEVLPAGVVMTFDQPENMFFRIKKNDVDCADLPISMIDEAKKEGYITLSSGEDAYGLVLNTHNERPTGNANLRSALIGAVDRNVFASLLPPHCVATQSVMVKGQYYGAIPYQSLGYQTDFSGSTKMTFQRAVTELGADAVKNLTLCYTEQEGIRSSIDSMLQCWQKAFGVNVTLKAVGREELAATVASGNFDMAICPMNNAHKSSLEVLQQFGMNSVSEYASYGDITYQNLLDDCLTAAAGDFSS
ncbi:MAG: peptide ABC transporter substrate-binding protein, partial [Clostridia bacterium]|nr:peptide ABC transporter substrate-binding protein [Clostridia bacterium]